jgi:uncharacterized protein CbrC (UPF0167 family)
MTMPTFRYHADPVASGSVVVSEAGCLCCGQARGFVYDGPIYAEGHEPTPVCPWCIADGSAHERFGACFVDADAFDGAVPEGTVTEITERTPGFATWQGETWPSCCGDAAVFVMPAGIAEIRARAPELEGQLMSHIVYEMGVSGGAATRLLDSLDRDRSPTLYVFKCPQCETHLFHIDRT